MTCPPLNEAGPGSWASGHETAPVVADAGAIPLLYMFHCRRADGAPVCLEIHELGSDEDALARARSLLNEHLTCVTIEVCEADRVVGLARRGGNSGRDAPAQRMVGRIPGVR